jgi:hypothetical protein
MLKKHTTKHLWFTCAVIALVALLPLLGSGTTPVAEAGKVRENTASASWTKCTGRTCTDTTIIATHRGSTKTLSFEETTYNKNTGKVSARRAGFARNVHLKQDGLNSASVAAKVAVKRCNAQDVCKNAGSVQVKAAWTGKGKTRTDPEDGRKVRAATATGRIAGTNPGKLQFANLTVQTK